ncbi:hypothetical protein HYZ64_01905, partial [Candidatus Berkelbacteria bacterium]|nr:hypothetical protein [Candidatus Berkelbacteria bacterium]
MELIKAIQANLGQTGGIELQLETEHGFVGASMIPQGVSLGAQEAKSVSNSEALNTITTMLAPMLIGRDVLEQRELDQLLMDADGTADRHKLGYNALLPVSLAMASAAAATLQKPLYRYIAELASTKPSIPQSVVVMVEGGSHAPQSNFPLQEVSVIAPYNQTDLYNKTLESNLRNRSIKFGYGMEGGLTLNDLSVDQVLAVVKESTQLMPLAVDCAVSHTVIDPIIIGTLLSDPRISIIEDPAAQDNYGDWQKITAVYGQRVTIAADDLTVGDPKRIKDALTGQLADCLV